MNKHTLEIESTLPPTLDLLQRWKESSHSIMTIVENTPSGICITNEHGLFEYVNSAYCAIYGYNPEELIGKHFTVVVPESNHPFLTELHDKYIEGFDEVRGEWSVQTKAGEERFILADAARITGLDGRPKKVTFVVDITSRKRSEDELARNAKQLREALATKDKFFSIIAHDLRNPFQALIMGAQLFMQGPDTISAAQTRKRGAMMYKAAQSALHLLENLLTWARTQTGAIQCQLNSLNLAEAVNNAIRPLQNKAQIKNILVDTNIQENIVVTADKYMLNTIILNLVSNALKFSNSGTSVTIAAYIDNANNDVTIAVRDKGVGIESNTAEKLFNEDIQQKGVGTEGEQGSGLGLCLCKDFVEKHGGKIWVESEVGMGSTFWFSLPKTRSASTSEVVPITETRYKG